MRLPREGEIWKYNAPRYDHQLFKIHNVRKEDGNIYVSLFTDPGYSRNCNPWYQWPNNSKKWQLITPVTIEEYI